MTLKQELHQVLSQLSYFAAGEEIVTVRHGGHDFSCTLVALDSLACAFTRLTLGASSLQGSSIDVLKKTAEKLSAKLTYLLEPISPIEIDAHGCVVQMRSNPPHKEADSTTYYELLVSRDGEISLCRYHRTPGQQRQSIPAHVTREVLCRLASDFSAAVA